MITQAGGSNYGVRQGYGDFPDNTGDWTLFIQFKYLTNPGVNYASILNLFHGDPDFGAEYLFLGSGGNDIELQIFDGSTTVTTAVQPIVANTTNWVAATYNGTTHDATLIVNGSVIGSVNIDLSGITWDCLSVLGDASGAGSIIGASGGYCRAWSEIRSLGELNAEAASITAVVTTGLLWDCLLQASIDLTAHNNTLNQLTAVGIITTDTSDPLLSVVAGPPTNTSPGTATVVTVDSAFFQDALSGGVAALELWHVCTAPVGAKVMGFAAFGDLTTYKPTITVYEGLANAMAGNALVTNNPNLPVQYPVTPGLDYYTKSARNGAVSPATLQLSVLNGLVIGTPVGTLAIPDVTSGFPLAFLDQYSGYPMNWRLGFPPGEEVGILSDGKVLVEDTDINAVQLFDSDPPTLTNLATPAVGAHFEVTGSNDSIFVAAKKFLGADQFVFVYPDGTVDGTVYSVGAGGLNAITLSPTAAPGIGIAYIIQGALNQFNIATLTTSAFVANIGGFTLAPNIICLPDGTVLAGYNHVGVACQVKRYNPDGSTANTYTLAADDIIERIAEDNDDLYFWVWSQPTNQYSRFYKIRLSDGVVMRTLPNVQKYNDGQYKAGIAVLNTPVRFGHSFSCPLWVTRTGVLPPQPLRLTQLPLEVAYDYAMLQRFLKGNGRNWITPPPS